MPGWPARPFYAQLEMTTGNGRSDRRDLQRRTLIVAGALLGVAAVLWLAWSLRNLLFMVFVSIFVAVAFEPAVHTLEKRGWRRGAATGVAFLVGFGLVVLFLWSLAPLFVEQISQLVESIPEFVTAVATFLQDTLGFELSGLEPEMVGENTMGYLQSIGGTVAGGVIGFTASVVGFLIFATTVALFSFYMVAELPKLQRTVLSAMPEEQQRRAMHVWNLAVESMGGYIYSRLILAFVSAALATAFLTMLDVRFALSLGIWVGVLSQFIPVVGTYLAAILPAIVALTFNDALTMLWVLVFFVAYQQVENYLISPRITKRTMEIHPAVSVAAILAGGALMGGVGIVLALPMTGIIQALISESRRRHDVFMDGDVVAAETSG